MGGVAVASLALTWVQLSSVSSLLPGLRLPYIPSRPPFHTSLLEPGGWEDRCAQCPPWPFPGVLLLNPARALPRVGRMEGNCSVLGSFSHSVVLWGFPIPKSEHSPV